MSSYVSLAYQASHGINEKDAENRRSFFHSIQTLVNPAYFMYLLCCRRHSTPQTLFPYKSHLFYIFTLLQAVFTPQTHSLINPTYFMYSRCCRIHPPHRLHFHINPTYFIHSLCCRTHSPRRLQFSYKSHLFYTFTLLQDAFTPQAHFLINPTYFIHSLCCRTHPPHKLISL